MLTQVAPHAASTPIDLVEIIARRKAERAASKALHPSNFGSPMPKPSIPLNRESELELQRRQAWPEHYAAYGC